ncbi:MAG: hypothetical protein ACYCXQ_08245 [Candidatus Humimicrobiaceae bacterium]
MAEDGFNAAVFIKDSPYCNTLHIVLYVELPIWGNIRGSTSYIFLISLA